MCDQQFDMLNSYIRHFGGSSRRRRRKKITETRVAKETNDPVINYEVYT
jgi:hypothetical protein